MSLIRARAWLTSGTCRLSCALWTTMRLIGGSCSVDDWDDDGLAFVSVDAPPADCCAAGAAAGAMALRAGTPGELLTAASPQAARTTESTRDATNRSATERDRRSERIC